MKKYSHSIWFTVITGLFVITRILAIKSAGSFWFDEAFSVHFSQKSLSEMWQFLQFEHNPLTHFLALHFWMNIFGASEFSARALSFVAGLGSLIGVYWLGRMFFTKQTGLWAMMLMTISTFFLYHQTEARMYSLLTLFAVLSIGSFWKLVNKDSRSISWLISYGVFTLLLVHTHLTAWILPLAFFVFWFIEEKQGWRNWKAWLVINSVLLISFLFWFIPVMNNKFLAGHISQGWFFFQQESGFALSHLSNYFLTGEANLLLRTSMSGLLLFLLFASFISLQRPSWWGRIKSLFDREHWPISFSFLWAKEIRFLLLLVGLGFGIGLGLKITVTKYLLIPGLAVLLLVASGMTKIQKPFNALIVALLFLFVLPMQSTLLFSQRHHWGDVANQVKQLTEANPDALVLSHSFVWSLPLSFYDYGQIEITPFYPLSDNLTTEQRIVRYNWQAIVNSDNVELLEQIVEGKNQVLLLSSTPNSDERDPVKAWFYKRGWKLEQVRNWSGYGDPELLYFVR